MSNLWYVAFPCLLLGACQADNLLSVSTVSESNPRYVNVDQRLWPYFEQFEEAALVRGIDVDLVVAGISGRINQLTENGVVGSCSYGGRRVRPDVIIDSGFWDRASDNLKEYIVFHELGHCFLFRNHLEDCLPNGIWVSLMRSGTLNHCRDFYNSRTRDYYIDELFSIRPN